MKLIYVTILLAIFGFYVASAQYAVASVHDSCESQCTNSSVSNCCGCCGSDSTCSGNLESSRCCPTNSAFCGCISNRAYCSGSVYNQSSSNRVSGQDSFGTCYDPNTASCSYDPSPNLWIVCPKSYTACESASFYSCCDENSVCTTNSASSYPICAPKSSSGNTGSNSGNTGSTTGSSGSSGPQPSASDMALAVPAENQACENNCPASNNTCCGCCSSPSNCAGNDISRRCCPSSSAFCGCISNRGYCQGSVYNSSRVAGDDTFGACYDPNRASCTYDPSPNLWIVCPKSYTACASNSFYTCCDGNSVCTTNSASSYPICAPKNGASTGNSATTGNSGTPTTASGHPTQGTFAAPTPAAYSTLNVGQQYTFTYNSPTSPSGNVYIASLGPQNLGEGSFSGSITINFTPSSSLVTGYYNLSVIEEYNQYGPFNSYNIQTNRLFYVQNSASSTGNSGGDAPVQGTCPSGLYQCGDACYQTSQYCCKNGQLTQAQFCTATPSTGNSGSSTGNSGTPSTGNSGSSTGNSGNPSTTNSGSNTCQTASFCGAGLCACGGACYSQDQYCCPNGQLVQKQFCTSTPSTGNSGSSTGNSGTPTTSSAPACTPVTYSQQSSCASGNPSRDNQCCVGNGVSLADGVYCGGRHQCSAGTCFLTGNSGYNCPSTPYTGSTSNSGTPSTGSSGGDAPVQGSCPSGLYQCGDACYQTSQYCCKNGQLTQAQFCGASATPSTGNSGTPSTGNSGTPSTGNSGSSTGNSGNPSGTGYVDTCQSASYCGAGTCACSGACYTQNQYCCKNNQLTQKQFC